MLVQKALSPQDVITAKLVTGEEIIARIVEVQADHLVITKPHTLVMTGMQNGQGMIAMAPFMLGTADDAKLRIDFSKIVTYAKARADAAGQYIKATSGIEVPQAGTASILPPLRGSTT